MATQTITARSGTPVAKPDTTPPPADPLDDRCDRDYVTAYQVVFNPELLPIPDHKEFAGRFAAFVERRSLLYIQRTADEMAAAGQTAKLASALLRHLKTLLDARDFGYRKSKAIEKAHLSKFKAKSPAYMREEKKICAGGHKSPICATIVNLNELIEIIVTRALCVVDCLLKQPCFVTMEIESKKLRRACIALVDRSAKQEHFDEITQSLSHLSLAANATSTETTRSDGKPAESGTASTNVTSDAAVGVPVAKGTPAPSILPVPGDHTGFPKWLHEKLWKAALGFQGEWFSHELLRVAALSDKKYDQHISRWLGRMYHQGYLERSGKTKDANYKVNMSRIQNPT